MRQVLKGGIVMWMAFRFVNFGDTSKSNEAASGKGSVNVVRLVVLVRFIVTRVGDYEVGVKSGQ